MFQLCVKVKFSYDTPSHCYVSQAGGRGFQFPMRLLKILKLKSYQAYFGAWF